MTDFRPELILVGVVHGDPEGYDKAVALLSRLQPRLVSVEISEYSWRHRQLREPAWQSQFQAALAKLPPQQRQHLALQRLVAQITMPFEVRAAADYGQRFGFAWRAIDINAIAREHLPRYSQELLQPDNLCKLLTTPDGDFQAAVAAEYERAARLITTPRDIGPLQLRALGPQATMREKVLAGRLTRLVRSWSKVVHLGGWEHLIRTAKNQTLADLLDPLQPKRLILLGDDLPKALLTE